MYPLSALPPVSHDGPTWPTWLPNWTPLAGFFLTVVLIQLVGVRLVGSRWPQLLSWGIATVVFMVLLYYLVYADTHSRDPWY